MFNNTIHKMTLAVLLIWISGLTWIPAQDQAAPRFIGSSLRDADAVSLANYIVVGQFKSSGDTNLDFLGESYSNAMIHVQLALKGHLMGDIRAFYGLKPAIVASEKEQHPPLEQDLLIFIRGKDPKDYSIVKVLPATDENITKVKALIRSSL